MEASSGLHFAITFTTYSSLPDQIQDASNHLMSALYLLSSPPLRYDDKTNKFDFHSAQEVIEVWISNHSINWQRIDVRSDDQ